MDSLQRAGKGESRRDIIYRKAPLELRAELISKPAVAGVNGCEWPNGQLGGTAGCFISPF